MFFLEETLTASAVVDVRSEASEGINMFALFTSAEAKAVASRLVPIQVDFTGFGRLEGAQIHISSREKQTKAAD